MDLRRRILEWLSGFLPAKIILSEGRSYLERYYLFDTKWFGGKTAYLHRFAQSDTDRGLHDHPWHEAISFMLVGRYRERRLAREIGFDAAARWTGGAVHLAETTQPTTLCEIGTVTRIVAAPALNHIRGRDFHRVEMIDHKPVWTIFIHDRKPSQMWGFLVPSPADGAAAYEPRYRQTEQVADRWWKTARRGRTARRDLDRSVQTIV